jgi:hypothetical protein
MHAAVEPRAIGDVQKIELDVVVFWFSNFRTAHEGLRA